MIYEQYIEINWSNRNKTYYVNKGYVFTKVGDKFLINVFDLTPKNANKVEVICDYCLEPYYSSYDNYLKSKENIFNKKDCCKKCSPIKIKEINILRYGVESTNKLENVINKKRKKMVHDEDFIKSEFENRGYLMTGDYVNANTPIEYICPIHINEGTKKITYGHLKSGKGCKSCAKDRIRGENHYNWNGGITELNMFLRDRMRQWVFDSLKNSGFKCDITQSNKNLEVHHLHNFKDIVAETLDNLCLKVLPKVTNYAKEELERIIVECLRLHYEYGFGVVLSAEIHREFHNKYGKLNNTKEQYFEFKRMKLVEIGNGG
jgi:hypothetical protein